MANHHPRINVDVIVPVHNAADTVVETVESAMCQWIPKHLLSKVDDDQSGAGQSQLSNVEIDVAVCCHDDGSTDDSLKILKELKERFEQSSASKSDGCVPAGTRRIRTRLLIGSNADGVARGAGFARNRAAELRARYLPESNILSFLCLLDSDDIMHPTRIAEQLSVMLSLPWDGDDQGGCIRDRTLLGCTFDRIPAGSTWHYSEWANGLSDERLLLERYREVTILQPTWCLTRQRFEQLGGYVEAPHSNHQETSEREDNAGQQTSNTVCNVADASSSPLKRYRLIHPKHDNSQTLRLAEDLRFFHEHLLDSGLLRLYRHGQSNKPLVTYRHRVGQSQSSSTPRKLLSDLRVMAIEDAVLRVDSRWSNGFVIWGAGRDGKDFFRSLSPDIRARVRCFVDVDEKKIAAGFYANRDLGAKVPIVHFSLLAVNPDVRKNAEADGDPDVSFGRITKGKKDNDSALKKSGEEHSDHGLTGGSKRCHPDSNDEEPRRKKKKKKKRKLHALGSKDAERLDISSLQKLPVIVCVAMYRTNGVLERNVQSIGRIEGENLWHFS